jgi:hypothetical protein
MVCPDCGKTFCVGRINDAISEEALHEEEDFDEEDFDEDEEDEDLFDEDDFDFEFDEDDGEVK